jgi:hypothetical protein
MLPSSRRAFVSNHLHSALLLTGLSHVLGSQAAGAIPIIRENCNAQTMTPPTARQTWYTKDLSQSASQTHAWPITSTTSEGQAGQLDGNKDTFFSDAAIKNRIFHWGTAVLALIQKYQQNPLRASRILSYTHVAMHDAWVLMDRELTRNKTSPTTACEYAAHRAASLLLAHFYPNEPIGRFEAEFVYLTHNSTVTKSALTRAGAVGASVASQLIERSWQDGAARVWNMKLRPAAFDGIWLPAFPLHAVNPTEGMAPTWQAWTKPSTQRYNPPAAPRPGSTQYKQEVLQIRDINRNLTAAESEAATRWNLEAGSVTPAGVWFQLAREEIYKHLDFCKHAHSQELVLQVLTDVSVAMHDAFIACWGIKFRDWSERPITAVRRHLDPKFLPLLVTPSFPGYVSGHATVSSAAAGVLSHHFPLRKKHFGILAQEAADSRLWGGIHFESDNQQGLLLGAAVSEDLIRHRYS